MKQNSLRFSYDKILGKFGFNDFKVIGEQLEGIVKASRNSVDSKVLTCEDSRTYNWSGVSILSKEVETALQSRQEYSLAEVDKVIWDKSYKLQLNLCAPETKESFMVCFRYDRNEKNRLFFYGQSLDEKTYHGLMNQFHKKGLFYRLGDGFSKPSELQTMLAMSKLHLNF